MLYNGDVFLLTAKYIYHFSFQFFDTTKNINIISRLEYKKLQNCYNISPPPHIPLNIPRTILL